MTAKQPEKAFRYAEQGKARGLLDLMTENRFWRSGDAETHKLSLQLRESDARRSILTGQLAKERSNMLPNEAILQLLSKEISAVETERVAIEQQWTKVNPGIPQRLPVESPVCDVHDLAASLDADTLLVEYLLAGDDLMIWAVGATGMVHAEAFKVEDWLLKSEIIQLRQAVTLRRPWQTEAVRLSERLLQPIAVPLRSFAKIIIVPHGPLHTLPFQLLPFDGQALGLKHALCYLPSATALSFLDSVLSLENARVLVIGNQPATYRPPGWKRSL